MLSDLSRNLIASIYVLIAAITFRSEIVGERNITTNGVRSLSGMMTFCSFCKNEIDERSE
jgi:hypothetical protein